DLDLGLVLEFFDRREQRVVLGLVEALGPPDGQRFLRQRLACKGNGAAGDDAGDELVHRTPPSRCKAKFIRPPGSCRAARVRMNSQERPQRKSKGLPCQCIYMTAPRYHGTNSFWP